MNNQLTPHVILSVVQSGKVYKAEFIVSVPSKVKELTKEICAFTNAAGGVLRFGVDDDNNIKGYFNR
jgi:ATP-dependent DNA helicase RecG